MSNFSTQACYAVLSTYTSDGESPLQALLKMVVTLVDERKYAKIDPQDMVADFYKKYHFRLPYHPMQIVINLGIDEGYFEYNSSLGVVHPIWGAISSDEFMKIFNQRESEYKDLLRKFDQFLQEKYDKHCSMEDLSDRVQAFIQRYGLTPARPMGESLPLPSFRKGQCAVPAGERGWHRRAGRFADRHQYRCHDRGIHDGDGARTEAPSHGAGGRLPHPR